MKFAALQILDGESAEQAGLRIERIQT